MAKQTINNGETGLVVRGKLNDNFTELYDADTAINTTLSGKANTSDVTTALAGKANVSHTHAAADVVSGTLATARLGSGIADNTTFLRGDQTWAVPAGGGGASVLGLLSVPVLLASTGIVANAPTSTALSTQAQATNVMRIAPFVTPFGFTIDQVLLSISTGVASNACVLIYDADSNGRPTTLLFQSANIDCTTAGTVSVSASFTFTANKLYWVGVWSSSTATLRALGAGSGPVLGYSTAATPVLFRVLSRTLTYGTADNWTFSNSQLTGSINPALVLFRTA